ncbi:MAG: hypothetical protein WCG42_10300 [Parachlamydiaceae bacterium]
MSLFTFSASGADDQIGSSPKEVFSTADGGGRVSHKREAAHSSTLPALIAHAKDGSTPNGFVYLKGGSSHSQHNATIGMNECVNGADELIDGKGTNENLRNTTLKIINRVADGLDPVSATKEFIQSFKARVSALTANDNRSFVLREYKKGIEIIQEASKDETLYDRMLGVVIDSNDSNATKLREIVYQRRYDIIRLQEVIESRIGKRIQNMKDAMNKTDRSFVNYILLKKFSDANERQTLEKLFGMTAVIFEQEYEELLKQDGTPLFDGKEKKSLRSFKTKVSNISEKYRAAITGFQKDLENDFNELRCAEWSYRAKVFKDIRVEVKNWTQPEFCDHYLAKVGHRISKTWVSRMENLSRLGSKAPEDYKTPVSQRRKYLSLQDVKNCAKAFGVDAGLFLPSLFTGV